MTLWLSTLWRKCNFWKSCNFCKNDRNNWRCLYSYHNAKKNWENFPVFLIIPGLGSWIKWMHTSIKCIIHVYLQNKPQQVELVSIILFNNFCSNWKRSLYQNLMTWTSLGMCSWWWVLRMLTSLNSKASITCSWKLPIAYIAIEKANNCNTVSIP